MMVISVPRRVVLSTDVDNNLAFLKLCGISGPNQRRRRVCRQQTEKVNSEGFVCVEMTTWGVLAGVTFRRIGCLYTYGSRSEGLTSSIS